MFRLEGNVPASNPSSVVARKPTRNRRLKFKFRLYVAGDLHNSTQAVANLGAFCRLHLPDRHEVEIVNVFREPKRALADGILMTPTLVKLAPPPAPRRVVGTLNETQPLLHACGIEALAAGIEIMKGGGLKNEDGSTSTDAEIREFVERVLETIEKYRREK